MMITTFLLLLILLPGYKTRISMKDIPQRGILLVTLRDLTKNDSGRYSCGIGKNNNIDLYFAMKLNILEDPKLSQSPDIFWGKVSGSVTIKCSSEGHAQSERKFLCKLKKTGCSQIMNPKRVIFSAEDSSGNFEVFINRLRKEDSGMYKCGTGTLDSYTGARTLQLQVTEESVFSNILSYAQTTFESQTSSTSQSYTTSANEFYNDSFSQTKLNILSIVMSVLFVVLILAATVITVCIQIKRQKKYDPGDVDARKPKVAVELTEQMCPVEHPKEENRGSDEQGSAVGPLKEAPDSNVYLLLGVPHVEESSKKD
ncbi:uncharacterized protein LOC143836056 isoform X2 [Paroedura picta]|uniref:uncharacterized protein LOC143836056 isoform X2 n=1 Tax=Paroedura picta TaxID=143630 RepID=UPI0040560744